MQSKGISLNQVFLWTTVLLSSCGLPIKSQGILDGRKTGAASSGDSVGLSPAPGDEGSALGLVISDRQKIDEMIANANLRSKEANQAGDKARMACSTASAAREGIIESIYTLNPWLANAYADREDAARDAQAEFNLRTSLNSYLGYVKSRIASLQNELALAEKSSVDPVAIKAMLTQLYEEVKAIEAQKASKESELRAAKEEDNLNKIAAIKKEIGALNDIRRQKNTMIINLRKVMNRGPRKSKEELSQEIKSWTERETQLSQSYNAVSADAQRRGMEFYTESQRKNTAIRNAAYFAQPLGRLDWDCY